MKKFIFYIVTIVVVTTAVKAQTTYPIVWTNPMAVTVNADNTLTKTSAVAAWDATIVSQNVLLSGQDGYVQFTYPGGTANAYMVSLTRFNNDPDFSTNDYSLYVSGGTLSIYNTSTNLGSQGALAAGDVLKIAREANAIKFYKNTTVLRTITLTANTDYLRVDASIRTGSTPVMITSFIPALVVKTQLQHPGLTNNDGSISVQTEGSTAPVTYSWSGGETTASVTGKARGSYTASVTDGLNRTVSHTYNLGYPVAWTNLSNININADNTLTKTGEEGWGISGASSLNMLPANTDGWVEFVVNEPSSYYMIGLSRRDNGADYRTIDYCWYVTSSGILSIYESGISRGGIGSLMKGDVLRIAREGTLLRYYLNGVSKRSITVSATIPFVIDVSVYNSLGPLPVVSASFDKQIRVLPSITLPNSNNTGGAIALNVQGTYAPATISWSSGETSEVIGNKPRGIYTATITDATSRTLSRNYHLGYPIEWTDLKNAAVNPDNTVYKLIYSGVAWDASAVSANVLTPLTDGWVNFSLPAPGLHLMIGLARLNTVVDYPSIEYGFSFYKNDVYIYESGTSRGIVASQVEGDVFTIAREGSSIKYYINGVVIRTVATTPSYQFIVDSSIVLGPLPSITASFTRTPQTYYTIANGNWNNPAIWSLSEGGAPATVYPGSTDIAMIKGHTVTVNNGINSGEINITANNEDTCLKVESATGILTVKGDIVFKGENNPDVAKALIVHNNAKINVIDR